MFYPLYKRFDRLDFCEPQISLFRGIFQWSASLFTSPGQDLERAFFQREKGTTYLRKKSSFKEAFDVHSHTMLFSFPFVFARLSLSLLMLTVLAMGMTNEENFEGSTSRHGSLTGGDGQGHRHESFWQKKSPSFVHGINT